MLCIHVHVCNISILSQIDIRFSDDNDDDDDDDDDDGGGDADDK